jgi:hypothetical protein
MIPASSDLRPTLAGFLEFSYLDGKFVREEAKTKN